MIPTLAALLKAVKQNNATDLLVAEGQVPCLRMHGQSYPIQGVEAIPEGFLLDQLGQWTRPGTLSGFESRGYLRFVGGPWEQMEWRVTMGRQALGCFAQFRPLQALPSLEAVRPPDVLRLLLRSVSGLLLFAGPGRGGKTTTSGAFFTAMAEVRSLRLRVLDPLPEWNLTGSKGLLFQTGLAHDRSPGQLESALRSGLKSGTDAFHFGDLEPESIIPALRAAEAGAISVACLRAGSAMGVMEELADACPAEQRGLLRTLLASHLKAVVVQHLIHSEREGSMVSAWEILLNSPSLGMAIRNGETSRIPQLIRAGASEGMVALDDSLSALVQQGFISKKDASRHALDSAQFE